MSGFFVAENEGCKLLSPDGADILVVTFEGRGDKGESGKPC